ncbi:MAG: HAMP domain-containing histidine kinase [Lachnospiraceae bacterium]|nr:HAMP domain-containing histidine kinase [Lachnospiraceae bacterium]
MGNSMWIAMGIAAAMGVIAAVMTAKYCMIRKCLKQAEQELTEIMQEPGENRFLLAACPSREAERLFVQINAYIQLQQRERINWQQQERQLREQIENISHDLRTPLTAILGYLELVDRRKLSGEDREALAVVERKSRYLQRLIGDFYDLSRLERADIRLELKPVELTRLIRETVLAYYPELTERHLEVELMLPDTAVMILGDRGAVERILQNMLQNALRYARSTFGIRVNDSRQTEMAASEKNAAEVRSGAKEILGAGQQNMIGGEYGICIDFFNDTDRLTQSDIPHLFERFYTADSARPSGSTGLGLTISRLLAEAMDGQAAAMLSEQNELHITFSFRPGE